MLRRAAAVAAPPRRDAAEELLTLRVFIGSGCCLERVERRDEQREVSLETKRREESCRTESEGQARVEASLDEF